MLSTRLLHIGVGLAAIVMMAGFSVAVCAGEPQVVLSRNAWPRGIPYVIGISIPSRWDGRGVAGWEADVFLHQGHRPTVRLRPSIGDLARENFVHPPGQWLLPVSLGQPGDFLDPSGKGRLTVVLSEVRAKYVSDLYGLPRVSWLFTTEEALRVQWVASVDDVVRPVSGPMWDDAVASKVSILRCKGNGHVHVLYRLKGGPEAPSQTVCAGELRFSLDGGPYHAAVQLAAFIVEKNAWSQSFVRTYQDENLRVGLDGVSAVLMGTTEGILQSWTCQQRYSGVVEIPIVEPGKWADYVCE